MIPIAVDQLRAGKSNAATISTQLAQHGFSPQQIQHIINSAHQEFNAVEHAQGKNAAKPLAQNAPATPPPAPAPQRPTASPSVPAPSQAAAPPPSAPPPAPTPTPGGWGTPTPMDAFGRPMATGPATNPYAAPRQGNDHAAEDALSGALRQIAQKFISAVNAPPSTADIQSAVAVLLRMPPEARQQYLKSFPPQMQGYLAARLAYEQRKSSSQPQTAAR